VLVDDRIDPRRDRGVAGDVEEDGVHVGSGDASGA
jgi:hypothetical protein